MNFKRGKKKDGLKFGSNPPVEKGPPIEDPVPIKTKNRRPRMFVLEWRTEGRWGCKFWTVWNRYRTAWERDQAAASLRNKYGRLGWVFRNKE